jgi:predicted enzyme related to lactoylglutathione lyase
MGVFAHDRNGGGVGGAICCGEGYRPSAESGPGIYLNAGDELNTVLGRVEAAGGQIVLPKSEIYPDMGHFAFFY